MKDPCRQSKNPATIFCICVAAEFKQQAMPKDHIDYIVSKIKQRRSAARGPVTVPKAILRKYTGYLPKPPPPKLRDHRPSSWGEESKENRENVENERDWFPNAEYQEDDSPQNPENGKPQRDTEWDDEMENMQETWDDEEMLEEAEDGIPDQQEMKEEDWSHGYNEELWEGQNEEEEGEQWEEWPEEEEMDDWEEENAPPEDDNPSNGEEAPIPAPKLRPVYGKTKNAFPIFVPLNKGKEQPGKGKGDGKQSEGPPKGHPTPLTHPVVAQNPLNKGMKGKGNHPIDDPSHPVHQGRGIIIQPGVLHQPTTNPQGGWIPPPYPAHYPAVQFPCYSYHPSIGPPMPYAPQEPGRMMPPWMQHSNQRMTDWIPDLRCDASEDTEDTSQSTMKGPKVRKKSKNTKKATKHKIWITVRGKRQEAYYWK